ncbi:hypothetical protein CRUP_032696 [Coryphaenoides rupestris]|nr:hypothetical protein CRUP_032696 [Coryphaenoides rupestris]
MCCREVRGGQGMSDLRPPGEGEEEGGGLSPVGTPDPPTASSTDVAPTREGRRRPRDQPPPCTTPHPEEQPTVASSSSSVLQGGWGYWGSWGKTLLSTATATANTVGQGLTQVMEKAETSLGIPSPAQLSSQVQEEEKTTGEARGEPDGQNAEGPSAVAMGLLSSLSSVVQSTSKTVISGGLDALEFIGKKTMDVMAEGDPGFRRTKSLMTRPSTLSQVLREAKQQEECRGPGGPGGPGPERRVVHYGRLFEDFQGLAHLEALEILSRESQAKVACVLSTLSGEQLAELRGDLELLRDSCCLEELDEEQLDDKQDVDSSEIEEELAAALERLDMSSSAGRLREEVHAAAISSLAEVTARSIQHLLRAGEKILLLPEQEAQRRSSLEQSQALAQVTVVLCKEISLLSKKFTSCLTFTGASNSASYLQDAFQLLLPILQISHINRTSGAPLQ